jgi:hypothetical protein
VQGSLEQTDLYRMIPVRLHEAIAAWELGEAPIRMHFESASMASESTHMDRPAELCRRRQIGGRARRLQGKRAAVNFSERSKFPPRI